MATGIAPALQSTRLDMAGAMKEGTPGTGCRSIAREGLIVAQVALSVLLRGAGGLLVRSFFTMHRGPVAIVPGPAVLIAIAALAIALPARRAMQQNPVVALRSE